MLHFFFLQVNNIFGDYMTKRASAAFFVFCMILGILCLRLYTLSVRVDAVKHTQDHYKKITLDYLRLPIYDCRGELLCNKETEKYVVARPVSDSLSVLRKILPEKEFVSASQSIAKGNPVCRKIEDDILISNKNIITLRKYVRYSENASSVHLLGYTDIDGTGVSGIEKALDEYLKTDVPLYAGFDCDANGHIMTGSKIITDSLYNSSTGGVRLTIDSRIQQIVEKALEKSDIKKGAVLICSTKSGAIRAMASVPGFNSSDISESLSDTDSPLVNRAISPYPVGSVFKAVVAAAALDNGIAADYSINCTGSIKVDDRTFHCNNNTAHGVVDMQKALTCSCNCYFVKLAQTIGYRPILETAGILGYGKAFTLAENYNTVSGNLPTAENLHSSGQLALFSFGQGTLSATTIQIANTFSAIGNNGEYIEPYVVTYGTDADGKKIYEFNPKPPIRVISEESAVILKNMLKVVVKEGTAKNAQTEYFESAGKTATAQTGVFNADKTEKLCTWFGGFFPADNPKYTVVILKEDGTTGGEDCAPIFRNIAEEIYKIMNNKG